MCTKISDICEYELSKKLAKFTQKYFTKVKTLKTVLGGATFFETPCSFSAHLSSFILYSFIVSFHEVRAAVYNVTLPWRFTTLLPMLSVTHIMRYY